MTKKKRKRVDYDSLPMNIYNPEYQYLMRQNAPENANVFEDGGPMGPTYDREFYNDGLVGTERIASPQIQMQNIVNTTAQNQYNKDIANMKSTGQAISQQQSAQPSTGSNVNWGGVIGAAATATANAISNGGSAADIVANAMGIPVLAKMWKANTEWGDARIKEAQEKISNPSIKYIQDANDIQGAGQGIKLNNQKDLNLIDTSGMLTTNNWKKFSSGRGSGTWWKNMATAQLQGAASGSVGGPWGALGGATAGLFGAIGGLFGSKKRAKKAMREYNNKMTTIRNYSNAENFRRITERDLSNQNILSNAMTSQKLQDMANFKAYGGNLFDGGGDLTDEQQMVLADIQADPRILFTPKYSQWRDYIRRTSPDYLDRLYASLPYKQQKDIYQNDREAWGALSNEAKGNFGGVQVRNESNEVAPYFAAGLGAALIAPAAIEGLATYAVPSAYNGVVNGLNAASDYAMGTKFGQAIAPYVSKVLKPAADATFAIEGAKNFASSEGFNKTWNHFANGEIANGITSGLGDAFDLLMMGQGKPLLDATKEVATAIKKGGRYARKQITASSRAKKLLNELDERVIDSDKQLAAFEADRQKANNLAYKAKQFFHTPSINEMPFTYVGYEDRFYDRVRNLLKDNKIDEAEALLNKVNSPYKITRLPNGEYGLPLDIQTTSYSDGFLLGEKKMYNPLTGQYDSYYLDPSGLPSNTNYLTRTGEKLVKMDGSGIPKDYRNTISKNIDYITNELYPGTSPFGSSVLTSEGNLYTNPHDFEVYMPESMLGKYKTNEWNQISPDTYTFTHPQVGDIDFNILRETPDGFATGQRSWQLASRQHPDWYKQYADKRFEDIAKGVKRKPIEQDPLPWTPQELLENTNPNINTLTDALFANKNAKHRNRRLYYLNNAKIDDLKASINEYGNYVMGGNYKPSDVPLSAFNDPSTNSKILNKMGIRGIEESVINDPERMKTLFEYSILHKQFYGRGVKESNIAEQGWDAIGRWRPDTNGGTANGVGLNTVRGGNSEYGNAYSILQPKSIDGITDPLEAIKVLDESVGIKELSNSERQQIRDAINNLGIDMKLPTEFSLKDVLRETEDKTGVKYQQLNKAIEEITNTSGITNQSEYGTGFYTSLWDLPQSKSANIIFGDLDRPNNPELLNVPSSTGKPLFSKFLNDRVADKGSKEMLDFLTNHERVFDSQSSANKLYNVSEERKNSINSYRDLLGDRRRNIGEKLAKVQDRTETIKTILPTIGVSGAVFGGIGALRNMDVRNSQIREDAQKAGIDMKMHKGETRDEYYDRLERELMQMGFYGQDALEEYNQSNNNTEYAMGGNLYPDGGNLDPYYPPSSDPDAVNWLSDWYAQRPAQVQNTFGNNHNLSFAQIKPNMNGSYYGEDNVPSDRKVNYDLLTYPTEEEYNKNLYKNLIDRAAASSNIFSENMWEGAGGTYSNDGIHFVQNPNFDPHYNDWLMRQWKEGNYVDMDASKNTPETLISGDNYKNTIMYNWKTMNERNDAMPTRIHERTHSMVTDPLLNSIDTGLQNSINSRVKLKENFNKEHYGNNDAYWDNPNEIYSRMNEFRYESGLKGSDNVDQKFLNDNRKLLEEKGLDRYTDESLLKLFNEVASNNTNNYNNIAAMGGNLYTDLSPNMISLWNDKQNIDKQKVMNQQMNFGLGNSFNQKLNTFDYGGAMNGMDLPTGMQFYENGGTHEQNPYGGIQVGVDQQGNPNLVEEGEFRWGDYVFSDRIEVDPDILSMYNITVSKSNKKSKNKPSYADMAKKYADKNKELANDPISKNSLNAYMNKLQKAQDDQKYQEQLQAQQDQQLADYRNALKSPTQSNPMYGSMKYNGMGNANQVADLGNTTMGGVDNSALSNVNRSGNEMMGQMAAYGGNIFALGSTMYNPYKILPVETLPGGNQKLYGKPISYIESSLSLPTKLNNPLIPNRELTLLDATPEQRQIILNNLGYDTGGIGNGWGEKSKAAWDKFIYNQTHPNTQYGSTQAGAQNTTPYQKTKTSETVGTSTKTATKTPMQVTLKDENTSDENIKAINGDENAINNTMAVSGKGPQETVSVDHGLGRPAARISDYTDPTVPMYNDNGYWANLGKGIMPNLMNWSGQANWKYNPKWMPSNELEALGHGSYASRISDHLGDYIAPDFIDVERLNNAAMAQAAAHARAIQNVVNGRATGLASLVANDYNSQIGIGNNYVTAEQYNAEQKQKAADFNRATNQFNAQANNDMYKDNLTAWMQGRQMDIQAMEAANKERQLERQYKDRVDRDAALNRSSDLGAMTDNMINTVVDNALYNRGLNNTNTKLNNRYYFNKDNGWTYKGDTGIGRQINNYAEGVRLTSDDYTQINNILKEDPHNIAGIEGIIDTRRAEQNKQDIKDFNDKHNSIISDFDNYSSLLDDALFSDIYKNEDRLAFNKARDKYEEVINNKNSTSSQKEEAYYDFKNKVNQMKNKYSLYKGMVDSQRNKSFDLTPEEYAVLYKKRQNKNAYGGKINTRKYREYNYMEI